MAGTGRPIQTTTLRKPVFDMPEGMRGGSPGLINIEGLSKPKLLADLYNNAREQTYAYGSYPARNINLREARALIKYSKKIVFTRIGGRTLEISLEGNTLDPSRYDLHNGQGTAKRVIEAVRASSLPEEQPHVPFLQRIAAKFHLSA